MESFMRPGGYPLGPVLNDRFYGYRHCIIVAGPACIVLIEKNRAICYRSVGAAIRLLRLSFVPGFRRHCKALRIASYFPRKKMWHRLRTFLKKEGL